MFLDGHLVDRGPRAAAGDVAPHPPANRSGTLLGSQKFDEDKSFHSIEGCLDEVRISKVARYDRDFFPAGRFEPDADTVALYHCDEGQGHLLKDSSGNGHHGQIVGAKWVKAD